MIISNLNYLSGFKLRNLPVEFVTAMEIHAKEAGIHGSIATPLKLLECFCDISGIKFTYPLLSRKKALIKLLEGFTGALLADDFAQAVTSTKIRWINMFFSTLSLMGKEIPEMPDVKEIPMNLERCSEEWLTISGNDLKGLDQNAVRYWQSWPVVSVTGHTAYLQLSEIWHSHGPIFADSLHQAWKRFVAKSAKAAATELNRFCVFLSKNHEEWPVATFKDPLALKNLFMRYMKDYFLSRAEPNKPSFIAAWNTFIANIEGALIGPGVWARPFTAIPRIEMRNASGPQHKIKANKEGVEIQDQLITEIPLNITDSEAIELIFHKMKYDISVVRNWALAEAQSLYDRVRRRVELGQVGHPYRPGQPSRPARQAVPFENHCATFELHGLPSSFSDFKKQYGEKAKQTEMAFDLGIPTEGTLFPHQCLLVCEHPKITPTFLLKLELYNKNGVISGFLPTDTGYNLIGFKDRRGPSRSEMKIILNESSTRWVKEVIEITEPLRKVLREKNDDRWRFLFLSCGQAFANPGETKKPWTPSGLISNYRLSTQLKEQFAPHTPLREQELLDFISRVTLSRLRASCGVAVYLETKDVKEMAKALGHAKYSAQLLSHYLPQSLLAFFQSRWVRIFQRGMIVRAMEGSPYLLEAASFASMAELHTFLSNHALKDIPAHLEDPEHIENTLEQAPEGASKIYIGLGADSLTALLSLESAVKQAARPNEVSGKARYWAEFANVVTAEIERDNDDVLHSHLALARQHFNPARMESLIYDAA